MKEYQFKKNDGSIDITVLVDAINPTDDSTTIYQVKGLTDANIAAGIDLGVRPISLKRLRATMTAYNTNVYELPTNGRRVQLREELEFVTQTVPDGVVNAAYESTEIEFAGGIGDITLINTVETNLPTGMTFSDETFTLAGTPTEAGDFSLSLVIVDSEGISVEKVFEFTIAAE